MGGSNVADMVAEVEEAAIDAFMATFGYQVSGDGERYVLWGWFDSMSYDRFGGYWTGPLASVAGSHAENFAMIRDFIAFYASRWADLPSGATCGGYSTSADSAASALGIGRAADSGAPAMEVKDVVELGIDDVRADLAAIVGLFTAHYRHKYVTEFSTINRNLGIACATLAGTYAAQVALWDKAPRDAEKILTAARDALLAQAKASTLATTQAQFTVVAAVAGAIGTVISGGTLPVLFGLASAATGLIGEGIAASADVAGDAFESTLTTMGSALDSLNVATGELEGRLASLLTETSNFMTSTPSKINLDAVSATAPYPGLEGIMKMESQNADNISARMGDIHEHLAATLTGFGSSPSADPTARSTDVGLHGGELHAASAGLHGDIVFAFGRTRDEYARGLELFNATKEAYSSADAAAVARVTELAAAEALQEPEA